MELRYRFSLLFTALLCTPALFAQNILNGDFELTTATADLINLSNAEFNADMQNVTAFGTFGDMDIITSTDYGGGGAQHGAWYVALTGGGTDAIAMELSSPLTAGMNYTMSFWHRADVGYVAYPFEVGVTTNDTVFGTLVHTMATSPVVNTWNEETFTFQAPLAATHITIRMQGALQNWVNLDHVRLVNPTDGITGPGAAAIVDGSLQVTTDLTGQGTWIRYDLAEAARVDLRMLDVEGRVVANWGEQVMRAAGHYEQPLAAPTGLAHGVYTLELSTGRGTATTRFVH